MVNFYVYIFRLLLANNIALQSFLRIIVQLRFVVVISVQERILQRGSGAWWLHTLSREQDHWPQGINVTRRL